MSIIFKLLYVLTENLIDVLTAVFCKQLLHILKYQYTSDFKIFSLTFVKMFLSLHK